MEPNDKLWREVLDRLNSYEGTLVSFCKQENIKKHQLYYYKKKFEGQNDNRIFQAITLKEEKTTTATLCNYPVTTNIEIKIGKAFISIPSSETETIKTIIKGLIKLC